MINMHLATAQSAHMHLFLSMHYVDFDFEFVECCMPPIIE